MSARNIRRVAAKENGKAGPVLKQVPRGEWPAAPDRLLEVWRSSRFLAQVFAEEGGITRISVCRITQRAGQWEQGITWDELMQVKREIGHADDEAVEVYPRDRDVVNVANMRHLWLLTEPLGFVWRAPA